MAADRNRYGGSVYDKRYFTDEELATADEMRRAAEAGQTDWKSAHDYVEGIRRAYGYTGGTDGSRYEKVADEDSYNEALRNNVNSLLEASRQPFSYDPNTDPSFASYAKQYRREGQRAAEDSLGEAAALTGGMPSTAAIAASQQAGNRYAAALADKIPELEQQSYNRYLGGINQQRANVSTLSALNDAAFQRRQYAENLQRELENLDYTRAAQKAETLGGLGNYDAFRALGFTDDEIAAMYAGREKQEDQAARELSLKYYKALGGGGDGGKKTSKTDKPSLTAEQAYKAIMEQRLINPTTRAAYEYYYGPIPVEMDPDASQQPESASERQAKLSGVPRNEGDEWGMTAGEYRAASMNDGNVEAYAAQMAEEGSSYEEIRAMLRDAYDGGNLSRQKYMALQKKYPIGG